MRLSQPAGGFMYTLGQIHAFYRAENGKICQIWNTANGSNGWGYWHAKGAPLAVDRPATMVTSNGQQHAFYRAQNGRFGKMGKNFPGVSGTWKGAPLCTSDPATLVTSDFLFLRLKEQQHVF